MSEDIKVWELDREFVQAWIDYDADLWPGSSCLLAAFCGCAL